MSQNRYISYNPTALANSNAFGFMISDGNTNPNILQHSIYSNVFTRNPSTMQVTRITLENGQPYGFGVFTGQNYPTTINYPIDNTKFYQMTGTFTIVTSNETTFDMCVYNVICAYFDSAFVGTTSISQSTVKTATYDSNVGSNITISVDVSNNFCFNFAPATDRTKTLDIIIDVTIVSYQFTA